VRCAAERLDQLEDFALALGASEERIALHEGRHVASEPREALDLGRRAWGVGAEQRGGQCAADDEPERNDVVLRDPAA
jgi:hypothetical protein